MLPESGRKLPKSAPHVSGQELADRIGAALRSELGLSRRATKTVMSWAGVCDRTARTWINGGGGLNGLHLIQLARHSNAVWIAIVELTLRPEATLGSDIHAVEVALARALGTIESFKRQVGRKT